MAAILKRTIAHVVQIVERTHRKLRPLAIIGTQECGRAVVFRGLVVRTRVTANPGLNFNPNFSFFLSKALSLDARKTKKR